MNNRTASVTDIASETAEDDVNTQDNEDVSRRTFGRWIFIIVSLVALLAIAIFRVLPAIISGQANEATSASVVTGLATLLLVVITWIYVSETQALVELTHEQYRLREQEREARIRSFRTALYEEIGAEQDWDRFRRILSNRGSITQPVPTSVYDTTPWRAGLLDEDERILIVKYYNSVSNLRQLLERTPSHELTTDEGELIQPIEDQIITINDLQNQALMAIEPNLDNPE